MPAPSNGSEMRVGYRMLGLSFQLMSEVLAGVLLGWLYDHWRGQGSSIGILIGGSVGIIVGLATLIRQALKINSEFDRRYSRRGNRDRNPDGDSSP